MRKLLATASAAVLTFGLATAASTAASANPVMLAAPAIAWIVGGGLGAGVLGGAIAANAGPKTTAPTAQVVASNPDQPAWMLLQPSATPRRVAPRSSMRLIRAVFERCE
jgi:hypothetical protein